MLTFKQFIAERVVNIGVGDDPQHELRQRHADQIHNILQRSYSTVKGGYGMWGSGTPDESDAIYADIHNPEHIIKATKRGDRITTVNIYKKTPYGRKSIASGTDGTREGKADFLKNKGEDIQRTERNVYGEVSGAPEAVMTKLGAPVVPIPNVKKILKGKRIHPEPDNQHYRRILGGEMMRKIMVGNPKL